MIENLLELNSFELLYFLILALGVGLSIAIILSTTIKYGINSFALRPIIPFTIFFAIIHFITPALKTAQKKYRYQDDYPIEIMIFNAIFMLSMLSLTWVLTRTRYFSPTSKRKKQLTHSRSHIILSRYRNISLLIFFTGLIFAVQDTHIIVNKIGYFDYLRDTHESTEQRSSYRLLSNLMILGCALYIAAVLSADKKYRYRLLFTLLLISPIIAYATLLNSRNTFFILFITSITVLFAFQKDKSIRLIKKNKWLLKKSSLRHIFIILILSYLALVFFSSLTQSRYEISDSAYALERREHIAFYALDGAFGNDENMLWLQQHDNFSPLYGKSYIAGFLSLIPRSIWPEKPYGAGPELINMIRPGSFVAGAEGNNSLTTGLITEAYMNFGYIGIILSVIIWAFISSRAMRRFHSSDNIMFKVGFLLFTLLLSSSFLYQEFLGFVARSTIIIAPIFFLGLLLRNKNYRKREKW